MNKNRSLPILALVAVLLVAAALRLWRLPGLPPGLWYDEAVNGVDIRMALAGQGLPLYFPANFGREPLFIYLQALSVALLGPTPFSLRLVSAIVGIGTILAVYACGLALFRPRDDEAPTLDPRWAAVLAAAVLAVTYWHVSLSRLGLRAVLLPLLSSIAILAFWRAWTGGRLRDFGRAGFWGGLTLYTYTSARALPLVLALFLLTEAVVAIWTRRNAPRSAGAPGRLRGLAVLCLVALLVAAPLLVELARHPATVLGRVGDVAASEGESETNPVLAAAANAVTVFRAFYDRGDQNVRHNLPGRPATDPLTAALFTVGLLAALVRFREPRSRLLLAWLGVMLLPSVLSGQAPHYLRAAGALPPFALLAALGGVSLARLVPEQPRRWTLPGLLALTLAVSGALTARDYFVRWPAEPMLAPEFTVTEQDAAQAADAALTSGRPIDLPHALYATPNLIYRLGAITEQRAQSGPDATMASAPVWRLRRDGAAVIAEALASDGAAWQPATPLNLQFANGLRLVGYDAPAEAIAPGAPITLTLYWEPADGLDTHAALASEVFAHLVADGAVRETDNGALLNNYRLAWPALHGLLVDVREFSTRDLPAGKATFEVGLYTRMPWEPYSAARRVPLVDGNGNAAGDQIVIAPLMIGAPAPRAETGPLTPLSARFEGRIALIGWRLDRGATPNAISARFCWTAESRIPTDLTAFVHLLDAGDTIVSQFDAQPGGPENPTSRWAPGETVCSDHPLTLPNAAQLADYRLRVGLYEPVSGRQWSVDVSEGDEPATYLILRPEVAR